jgi:hypothetical protein
MPDSVIGMTEWKASILGKLIEDVQFPAA